MLSLGAFSTGLRASELASHKPGSLDLLESPPTVTVRARHSERLRQGVLLIPSGLLDELRNWLAARRRESPLWPGKWAGHRYAGKVFQVNMKAAGIPYANGDGFFTDVHLLRRAFNTNLARHGVPLTTAKKLVQHSMTVLTAAATPTLSSPKGTKRSRK